MPYLRKHVIFYGLMNFNRDWSRKDTARISVYMYYSVYISPLTRSLLEFGLSFEFFFWSMLACTVYTYVWAGMRVFVIEMCKTYRKLNGLWVFNKKKKKKLHDCIFPMSKALCRCIHNDRNKFPRENLYRRNRAPNLSSLNIE